MNGPNSFALAPMSRAIAVATIIAVVVALGVPLLVGLADPEVGRPVAAALAGGLWVLGLAIWGLWRPRRFEITPNGLRIVFPLRESLVPAERIEGVRPVGKDDLGWVVRTCGAGGFLGAFGLHRSKKLGSLTVYASRSDGLVLIARRGARAILITPERPEAFVAAANDAFPFSPVV